ncbi:DNA methylase N-4/N-6 domain protein [Desulforamulus reducens MI-1]|uniref:DNA methylase N-4/N-6 domain protein n=1 Tax=Desulforamulus reducens (strain ATCC BAA-1160 / DSM 100696 / MI-1) TaxID=349161 RepID=A4J2V3_DESRM|nr:site-specific DNA-methyltransferase [Desulforamulus reducens]ABO49406.1 DNA methylase N-4/N-6 domain protein [Desulforamulus reducens MI-1]
MPILHWLDRDKTLTIANKIPFRLLEEDQQYSYGDNTPNMIIQGDNLEALKALLPYFAGQVKCIYIDPPYNIGAAFEHYDDNLEHSQWLQLIYPRLELLREFLSQDGSIWVSIDDSEAAYLKVIMDEIFGRKRFIACNVWQKRYSRENREAIGDVHEYIFTYAKNPDLFKKTRNMVPITEKQAKVYRNPNNDPLGRWRPVPMTAQEGHATPEQYYEVITPTGKVHKPPKGRCWGISKATYEDLLAKGRIYFGKTGNSQPNIIRYIWQVPGVAPWTWWPSEEVGHTDEAKKEIHALFGKIKAFDTPKPERLIQRIIHIATNPGDLIMDSFLGSGTTAAVAHKMGRRYIGVEMGEQAVTHVVPRLQKVVEGEQGGISNPVDWQGGGGFRFYRLGEPVFDSDGHLNSSVKFQALAAHIWFTETKIPYQGQADLPLLGIHNNVAYYLLYNGILGDKRPNGGNVLTNKLLAILPPYDGEKVIFGEATRLGEARLRELGITFKQTPYDLKMR